MKFIKYLLILVCCASLCLAACHSDDDTKLTKEQVLMKMLEATSEGVVDEGIDYSQSKGIATDEINETISLNHLEEGLNITGSIDLYSYIQYEDTTGDILDFIMKMKGTVTTTITNYRIEDYTFNGSVTETMDMSISGANLENMSTSMSIDGSMNMVGPDGTSSVEFDDFTLTMIQNGSNFTCSSTGSVTIDGEEVSITE